MNAPARALFVVTALVASITFAPSAVEAAACAEVAIIGAAGSGQTPGLGEQLRGVIDALVERLERTDRSAEITAIDYPAVNLARTFGLALFDGRYEESVRAGARELLGEIESVEGSCPQSSIVLAGYSQGAQVVKVALDALGTETEIGGVLLLADPTRDPSATNVTSFGTSSTARGLLGARPIPVEMRSVTIEACAQGDIFCSRGGLVIGAHTEGYAGLSGVLADAVVSKLSLRETAWPRPWTDAALRHRFGDGVWRR